MSFHPQATTLDTCEYCCRPYAMDKKSRCVGCGAPGRPCSSCGGSGYIPVSLMSCGAVLETVQESCRACQR